jgi:hypothetical protein
MFSAIGRHALVLRSALLHLAKEADVGNASRRPLKGIHLRENVGPNN